MTTVAYRGGVMATDSQTTMDNVVVLPGRANKIRRLDDGSLAAGAGNAFTLEAALHGARTIDEIKIFNPSTVILAVDPTGAMRLFGADGMIRIEAAPFFAIGSGTASALGAMHAGAGAVAAVKAAIETDVYSSGDVISASLAGRLDAGAGIVNVRTIWRRRLVGYFGGRFP